MLPPATNARATTESRHGSLVTATGRLVSPTRTRMTSTVSLARLLLASAPFHFDFHAAYKNAVYWIESQLKRDSKYLSDDTRFWVDVTPI